jgi:hypothetical protein
VSPSRIDENKHKANQQENNDLDIISQFTDQAMQQFQSVV